MRSPWCLCDFHLQRLIKLTDFYENGMNITRIETKPKPVFSVNTIWQAREIVNWEENTVGCVQEDSIWSPFLEHGVHPTANFYLSGKPKVPVSVCYLSTLLLTEITYRRRWMNEWVWAIGEIILRKERPKCAERSPSQRHLVHHKSHRTARDQTRVSAGRGLRLTAWAR
jgi:hypothetical protein